MKNDECARCRAETLGKLREAETARSSALEQATYMRTCAERCIEAFGPQKGMTVPYHGEFAGANPTVAKQILRFARLLEETLTDAAAHAADVCGKMCDHGSECLLLRGHAGGHDTQHGCMFYDDVTSPTLQRAELADSDQSSGLYEDWRGNQRSVRGSSGSGSSGSEDGFWNPGGLDSDRDSRDR